MQKLVDLIFIFSFLIISSQKVAESEVLFVSATFGVWDTLNIQKNKYMNDIFLKISKKAVFQMLFNIFLNIIVISLMFSQTCRNIPLEMISTSAFPLSFKNVITFEYFYK